MTDIVNLAIVLGSTGPNRNLLRSDLHNLRKPVKIERIKTLDPRTKLLRRNSK